jgi:hypothetical protein
VGASDVGLASPVEPGIGVELILVQGLLMRSAALFRLTGELNGVELIGETPHVDGREAIRVGYSDKRREPERS